MKSFLIVSEADDLHALAVQSAVRQRGLFCNIIESNQLSGRESINYHVNNVQTAAMVRTSDGQLQDVNQVDAIWWRRFKSDQMIDISCLTADQVSLINNDCIGAIYGILNNSFQGKWLSNPCATDLASNKLNQLSAAVEAGFTIPDTLISQSPQVVREFSSKYERGVIVKPVVGTKGPLLFTQMITEDHLSQEDSIRSSPSIYQEYISGDRHIRLNCFGDKSFAALIKTTDLDWRPNLQVPICSWDVPNELQIKVRRVLDILELEMGIFDLKINLEGEIIWLEVNPQGQFLFLEGITGYPLTERFVDFFTA
jgi:glutathione synthase/RimK-type ligase-like ATP-grasp enzyme